VLISGIVTHLVSVYWGGDSDYRYLSYMKAAITVFELSKKLNLSMSTVSRALKNHPNIAAETKERVLKLAQELHYEPNLIAVGLRTSSSMELAVIVPSLSGFFYDSFITALEEEACKLGYSLFILLSSDDPITEIDHLRVCRQRRVSGVFACITPQTTDLTHYEKLHELEIPVLFFDKVPVGNYNKICLADEQAAVLAAKALKESNRKKVLALFGNMNLSISQRRHEAFSKEFATEPTRLLADFAITTEEAHARVIHAFGQAEKPDALFCMSDEILIGAMKALQQLGLKIPSEMSVVAISNGFFPKLYHPEITYVETSARKLGKVAFQRMVACLEGDTDVKELTVESLFVQGASL
jgi:LacI family transcriptional regulator